MAVLVCKSLLPVQSDKALIVKLFRSAVKLFLSSVDRTSIWGFWAQGVGQVETVYKSWFHLHWNEGRL